jgi:hypothetical protein
MTFRALALLAGALLVGALAPAATFAGDAAKLTPMQIAQDRSRADIVNGLVVLGRADKDAEMLTTAAHMLAAMPFNVADPKASSDGKPVFYDADKLLEEAKGYPAKRSEVKKEQNSGFCHYEYLCDSLSCAYEWVC